MVHGRVQSEKAGIDGIIDVGVVVIAHFENPARVHAFAFLKDILLWKKRCLIPTSAIMGAYHVMTEYLGVDMAIDALENALTCKIESWDGFLVCLARNQKAPIIYSIDGKLARKVKLKKSKL